MADQLRILVCARVGHFADDVQAHCATCHTSIVYRPHVPPDTVKMCPRCAAIAMEASETEPIVQVTEETLREAALYKAKTRGTH